LAVNPDRLSELRRQRALAAEQLDWLDREIAAEMALSQRASATPADMHTPARETASPAAFESYQADPAVTEHETKRGCFLFFAATLVVLLLVLAAVYFLFYRDRPLLFVPR
jgi:hypothetical protein